MVPCDVYLYDRFFVPLRNSGIQINPASYPFGRNLTNGHVNNSQLYPSGKWGARLPFNVQRIVYTVTVHDPTGTVVPVHLTNLNGAQQGMLEIVMFPQAQGGTQTGTPPQSTRQIAAYIDNQPWSDDEKLGVKQLVRAVREVRGAPNNILREYLSQWENWLVGLGIDPTLVV